MQAIKLDRQDIRLIEQLLEQADRVAETISMDKDDHQQAYDQVIEHLIEQLKQINQ